jgi:YidC/Oxa1 family membrane protein insertase
VDFQRRTLLAIVVSVLIWVVYANFFAPPPPQPKPTPAQITSEEGKAGADSKAAEAKPEPEPAPASQTPAQTHQLKTELIGLDVGNIGGLVRRTELLSKQFLRADGIGDDFLHLGGADSLAISFDANETDFRMPRNIGWEVVSKTDKAWNLRYKDLEVEVLADLSVSDGYEGQLNVKVLNRSSKRQGHRMLLKSQYGLPKESSSYDIHRGLCATLDDVEEFAASDVEEQSGMIRGQIRWAALDSKYFVSAVVPAQGAQVQTCEVKLSEDGSMLVNTIGVKAAELEPNESRSYEFGLYLGTKEMERLERFAVVPDVHLEDAVDWGWFGGLTRFLGEKMLWLLRVFYGLTGIWGVAIILLTIVVKVVTLPLTFKQMRSMKKMREVQPELEALKKKYADDRVRQAQEMQALFQRAGVNPLAGCLPMLIQLPIWIALYAMLNTAVELYREPFLWLPDLTQQDPYYILPLAMGALMYFQMKIQPSGVDNEQAKMMAWMMPIIFTVMMLFLPSGLCVYIFANVLLSLVQTVIQLRPSQPAAKTS